MARKKSGSMTAAELQSELANDPEYQAMLREKEARRAALDAELAQDEAPLVQELRDAGVHVILTRIPWEEYEGAPRSVWDLVNTDASYPDAIPILVKHLQGDHREQTKEGIARALTVPEARGIATRTLIDEFSKTDDQESQFKWVLGAAIAETATPDTVSQIVELIRDKRHGKARDMLPLACQLMPKAEAESFLQEVVDDPDVRRNAIKALKNIRRKQR